MVSEARIACFGIAGARNRPSPTLFPSETCTQTPLNRPRMRFRRDPDFADAPETAQNGGFRHRFATARVFADFRPSSCDHRPKASFAREYWLRNVAGAKYSIAPQGHFFGLETGTYGHHSVRAGARARRPNRRAKPATGWFPSTQTALDPSLVRFGRLGAVMATRVAPAKVATTEKVPFGRCARLRAGAAIGHPPGARVTTADQGPHRARSTRARGSDISNGVMQAASSLYLSDWSTCHLPYVNDCCTCHAFGSVRWTVQHLRAWKASAEALSGLRALDCGRGHRDRLRCEWKARRRVCLVVVWGCVRSFGRSALCCGTSPDFLSAFGHFPRAGRLRARPRKFMTRIYHTRNSE